MRSGTKVSKVAGAAHLMLIGRRWSNKLSRAHLLRSTHRKHTSHKLKRSAEDSWSSCCSLQMENALLDSANGHAAAVLLTCTEQRSSLLCNSSAHNWMTSPSTVTSIAYCSPSDKCSVRGLLVLRRHGVAASPTRKGSGCQRDDI